jgi:hypothetical protein
VSDLGGSGYTKFERELLHAIFDAPTEAARIFREQIGRSEVVERRYSGAGSFTDIAVDHGAPTALGVCGTPAEQRFVAIWRRGMDAPAGCVVFVDTAGYINCLEVYTHSSAPWSDEPREWHIVGGEDALATENPLGA